ncbi:MAG: VanZ family protein [Phycisphaerales bacterium]|nr:MAG: VanZ family protein [Phycisphaerales bacterium]
MTTSWQSSPTARFIARHHVELLTLFAVLFVVQTGFVPFDFGAPSAGVNSADFFGVSTSKFAITDIVSNLLLYVPIGLLLHWSLYRFLRNSVAALVLAVILAGTLSGITEWFQAYSPLRVSSIIDLVCNICGALVGAFTSMSCRFLMPRLTRAVATEFRLRPQAAIVKAYACALLFAAAMPFSFSLDGNMLRKSLKSVTLVPFGAIEESHQDAGHAMVAGDSRAYAQAKWRGMKCWSRWAAEFTAFAVLAWLVRSLLQIDYRFGRFAAIILAWWFCGGLAVILSFLQFLLVTRPSDVTDVMFRFAGVAVGLALRSGYIQRVRRMSPEALARRHRTLAKLGCAATLAYIVYVGLIPLTFDTTTGAATHALASNDLLPFFAYFANRFDLMIDDVMEKSVSYALFAAMLVGFWAKAQRLDIARRAVAIAAIGIGVSIPLELVQMFISVRITSLTDPILAGVGCVVGVLAQEKVVIFQSYALARPTDESRAKARERAERELPPTDALIATLIGSDTEVPPERVSTRSTKSR